MEPNRTPRVPASKQADRPATTVGLFFGGRSAEHAVSIRSAATIHAALCNAGYQVVPIGIELGGSWRYMPLTQDTFHQEVDARACAVPSRWTRK